MDYQNTQNDPTLSTFAGTGRGTNTSGCEATCSDSRRVFNNGCNCASGWVDDGSAKCKCPAGKFDNNSATCADCKPYCVTCTVSNVNCGTC
jgi:hypothetical protein